MEKTIRIIDKRKKDRFFIDDEYLNGWAKKCGIYATGVYVSLCRHVNKEQKCWPSIKKMAEELAISPASTKRALEELLKRNIIQKERVGKKFTNRYFLLDKIEWTDKKVSSPTDHSQSEVMAPTEPSLNESDGSHRAIMMAPTEPSIERIHKIRRLPLNSKELRVSRFDHPPTGDGKTPPPASFNPDEAVEKLYQSDKRHEYIIGAFFEYTEFKPATQRIFNDFVRRNVRPASRLADMRAPNGQPWGTKFYEELFDYVNKCLKQGRELMGGLRSLETVYKYAHEFEKQLKAQMI